jgi:hypothetical protein
MRCGREAILTPLKPFSATPPFRGKPKGGSGSSGAAIMDKPDETPSVVDIGQAAGGAPYQKNSTGAKAGPVDQPSKKLAGSIVVFRSAMITVRIGLDRLCRHRRIEETSYQLSGLDLTALERSHLAFLGRFRHAVVVPHS